jgi:hypothetical protein
LSFPIRAGSLPWLRHACRRSLNIIAYEGNDVENNRFLRELAKRTGGVYRFVNERELREAR